MIAHTCEKGVHPILASNVGTCAGCQELVECPVCRGAGVLSNGHPDPQQQEDGSCHACAEGGSVTREHHARLLDGMTDDAALEASRRLADEDAAAREYAQLVTERGREWWA